MVTQLSHSEILDFSDETLNFSDENLDFLIELLSILIWYFFIISNTRTEVMLKLHTNENKLLKTKIIVTKPKSTLP